MPDTQTLLLNTMGISPAAQSADMQARREIRPIGTHAIARALKENHLRQRARAIWLYGLPGAGKSTLALALERRLHVDGFTTMLLDGDNLRAGLSRDLNFSKPDRAENIRRAAEITHLLIRAGIVVIASLITPARAHRELAQAIIGHEDFLRVHVRASMGTCAQRNPGAFSPNANGAIVSFELPADEENFLTIDTETMVPEEALVHLHAAVLPHIHSKTSA